VRSVSLRHVNLLSSAPLASISGSVVSFVGQHGVWAVFLLMAVDALLPVGGELTMLYAGVIAAGVVSGGSAAVLGFDPSSGLEAYLVMVAAGVLGTLLGAFVGWVIGIRGGLPFLERHGRWLHLGPHRVAKAQRWFDRFGGRAVFLGRLTPLVRSFISIPAGVFRSPLGSYLVLTAFAAVIWCAAFAGVGWAVSDSWESFDHSFHYVDYVIIIAVVAGAAYLLLRSRRRPPEPATAETAEVDR
jgi:membrane protein DedA with SNARE-associated domain